MGNKYNSIILALILASILSLVASVFYVNYYFTKELLLLAIMIIFAIGLFYGLATRKSSIYGWMMLFFVIGVANGFFMYFKTNALLAYLLIGANIIGFIAVLQTVPGKKRRKEPKMIIKEVKESPAPAKETRQPKHAIHRHKHKPAKLSEEELLKTEEQILEELDRAIEQKQKKISKSFSKKSRTSEYYDDDKAEKTVVPTREVDDFVNALTSFEANIKKAKARKPKKAAKKKKRR